MEKLYEMIFKEFCSIHMQNRIKNHTECDSISNYPLKLMDATSQ